MCQDNQKLQQQHTLKRLSCERFKIQTIIFKMKKKKIYSSEPL